MQGELFREIERNIRHTEELEEDRPVEKESAYERFQLTLTFDKLVITSIALVVLLAVTFALGVEKGKQKAVRADAVTFVKESTKPVIEQEWTSKSEAQSSSVTVSPLVPETSELVNENIVNENGNAIKESIPAVAPMTQKQAMEYTIRLASYVNRNPAQHTAEKLKKKGYVTEVRQSGKYFVLNVGRFTAKQSAEDVLIRLRKELGLASDGLVRSIS